MQGVKQPLSNFHKMKTWRYHLVSVVGILLFPNIYLPYKLSSPGDMEDNGTHDNRCYRNTKEYDGVFSGIMEKKFGHYSVDGNN